MCNYLSHGSRHKSHTCMFFLYSSGSASVRVNRESSCTLDSARRRSALRSHANVAELHSPIASIRCPRRCHTTVLSVAHRCTLWIFCVCGYILGPTEPDSPLRRKFISSKHARDKLNPSCWRTSGRNCACVAFTGT